MKTLTKAFSADMTIEDGSREMLVKITSDALDRDGEVLLPAGMDASEFEKNPVVFVDHSEMPTGGGYMTHDVVGKVVAMERKRNYLLAKILMLPRPHGHDGEWLADTILHMARFGILGVSVGFKPIEARNPMKKDLEVFGDGVKRVFSKWKLLEISITPMPANQEALILAVSKGLKRETAVRFYPKIAIPVQGRRVSLAAMVKREWAKVTTAKAVDRGVRMQLAKIRGRIYFDD